MSHFKVPSKHIPGGTEEEHTKNSMRNVDVYNEIYKYKLLSHDILMLSFIKLSHMIKKSFLLKQGRWARRNKNTIFLYLANGYIPDCIIIILQLHISIQH
jgi:hypothetical protein